MTKAGFERRDVPEFDRNFFRSPQSITRMGGGELGGKAGGLILIRDLLESRYKPLRFPGVQVYVPKMVVLGTDAFDAFIERNGLKEIALSDLPDDRIANAFLRSDLPIETLGDLRALVEEVRTPLAVRSSSLLEDALLRPFAGVYATKMVPNNQSDVDQRFRKLAEAIKFVYASTYFRAAKSYIRATDRSSAEEKMAVILQEVVGTRYGGRFYPQVAGVGRSYNFFPARGADPRDGVVNLALGLGKSIVDGGTSWIYSPARPGAPPPFNSLREMLRLTQLDFWAVNMGEPPAYDPTTETEYLIKADLGAADYDGTLAGLASTYDARRDRMVPGTGAEGPRVVDFAPLLVHSTLPVNAVIRELLSLSEQTLGAAAEIEFALILPGREAAAARFGFLQLRPMLVSDEEVEVTDEELARPDLLLASNCAMGNGVIDTIRDVVYVKPQSFEARFTPRIAGELDRINRTLLDAQRPYLLVGFGRWGSSDPWLGIPVQWGQIAGAKVIVESTLPGMDKEPSQGAHFFHNIISFQVSYLSVRHDAGSGVGGRCIDWKWLDEQPESSETDHVRHVRLDRPLRIKVDGRTGLGAVWRSRPSD
jgi:hypothetical protein